MFNFLKRLFNKTFGITPRMTTLDEMKEKYSVELDRFKRDQKLRRLNNFQGLASIIETKHNGE